MAHEHDREAEEMRELARRLGRRGGKKASRPVPKNSVLNGEKRWLVELLTRGELRSRSRKIER
jgi:hypothetical protein